MQKATTTGLVASAVTYRSVVGLISLLVLGFGAFFVSTSVAHAATFSQNITFTQGNVVYGSSTTLSGTVDATSTLPYYTSDTPAKCSVSGASLTTVAAGTCTITAHYRRIC